MLPKHPLYQAELHEDVNGPAARVRTGMAAFTGRGLNQLGYSGG